ncbi:unnamed protein product [Cladocopium goreaui]|uniref:Pentacotripeptide-repeat region of PRORP domain-containing protein n=1 Tax=Cladocopium goreaui TaxID=2562237 RepID=A0A9P1D9A6_9DINO|nr:unnamed protein product [Cladocopium goreaui]
MAAVRCQWALAELEQASISERTCNKVIATCGRQIQWQRAIQVLFQMVEVRQATSISCNSCMAACSRASHWQKALHLMRCLRGFIRHDGVTYKQAARAAGESSWRSGLRLLQEGFEKMTEADVIHYDLALSLRQSAGSDHWPEALHLMQNMVEAQVQADVRSYSSSMTFEAAWPTIGLLFQDLLQRMEADEYTCNTAVSAAPWVRAWCLLRRKEHGMSVVSHNAAMAGTPWFKAVQVLHTLETGGLKLTAVSSGTILSQSRDMEWQRPLWFLSRCQSRDIQSNSIVQSNVLAAHVDAGHWQETLGNVMAYHSRGGNLNVALKTLSLSAFSQAASWQKALALSASERIDVVLLNALVTCCARVARWQEGLEVVCGSLVRHSLRASVVTFNAALSACAAGMMLALGEAGFWQHAFEILKMFSSCNCEANVVSFTTAITACPAHQWPQSLVLVQQAASDAAGETSWAAAVTTLGRAVRWREAMCLGHIAMEGTHDAVMLAYGCYQMLGGGSAQVTELRACKKELKELIETRNCHPILVRLAWHDSGTYDQRIKEWPQCGGANGAIRFDPEMNMGANAGLDKARGYLQKIHEALGFWWYLPW